MSNDPLYWGDADAPITWRFPASKKRPDMPSKVHIESLQDLLNAYGIVVKWNVMNNGLEIEIPCFTADVGRARNATLEAVVDLARRRGLNPATVTGQLLLVASEYHPVWEWVRSKPWDGTARLGQLFATLELADGANADLSRVLFDRWMVSCVKAVRHPRPADDVFTPQGVLVLQGPQGSGKTQWFKSLQPHGSRWVLSGRILDPSDRDSVQQATSFWITELGELDSTYRKSDIAALKAIVTQESDTYRSAYARREETVPRRTVFGASVNPSYFLVDDTGNRRWWTIPVRNINWQHGLDMQQVWAEVVTMVTEGVPWWLSSEEQEQLAAVNIQHQAQDSLIQDLWEVWKPNTISSSQMRVKLSEIWERLPGCANKRRTPSEASRLMNALRVAGVENKTVTQGSKTYNVMEVNPQPESYTPGRWGNS